jgi:hypothetical protein
VRERIIEEVFMIPNVSLMKVQEKERGAEASREGQPGQSRRNEGLAGTIADRKFKRVSLKKKRRKER